MFREISMTKLNEFNLSSKEEEIIILKNALDIINNAVNYGIMVFLGNPSHEVKTRTIETNKLFLILLVDFLGATSDILHDDKNYCDHLVDICERNANNENIDILKNSAIAFKNWISEKIIIRNLKLRSSKDFFEINITRQDLVLICGNISKHNITNLTWKINKLRNIIRETKENISNYDVIISLYDLYEVFMKDYIDAQTTIWAELLNNIRIGILHYLKPVFNKSIVYENDVYGKYHYEYPPEISSPLAKEFFWDLMNDVRHNFYIKDFTSDEIIRRINKEQTI